MLSCLCTWTGEEFHRVSGSVHAIRSHVGWIVAGNHVMEETYPLTTPMLPEEEDTKEFEETPNDDDAALSDEDRHAM